MDNPYQPPLETSDEIVSKKPFRFSSWFIAIQFGFLLAAMAAYGIVVPNMGDLIEEFGAELSVYSRACLALADQGPLILFAGFTAVAALAVSLHLVLANSSSLKPFSVVWSVLAPLGWILFLAWTILSIFSPIESITHRI